MAIELASFDSALRLTEICVGAALIQHSAEHLVAAHDERVLFGARIGLAVCLLAGFYSGIACWMLVVLHLLILRRFDGPYNGGSDRMSHLSVICLAAAHTAPACVLKEAALGYLGLQVILSYAMSGGVKIVNPDWRNGRALRDVFEFSAYPASEHFRRWARAPSLMLAMSWSVIVFELLFPLSLGNRYFLYGALAIGAAFHLGNACLFGLNRFVWSWLATYPSLLWLQARI